MPVAETVTQNPCNFKHWGTSNDTNTTRVCELKGSIIKSQSHRHPESMRLLEPIPAKTVQTFLILHNLKLTYEYLITSL